MNSIIVACENCGTKNRIPADKQHLGPKCGRCNKSMNISHSAVPVELNDSNFVSFLSQARKPVMVDFYSPTCGPCRMLSPIIDNLARKFTGRVIIAKLDTTRSLNTPSQFQIRGVPTLIFFKNGEKVDQLTGAIPEETLTQKLNQLVQ